MIASVTKPFCPPNLRVELLPIAALFAAAVAGKLYLPAWGFMWLLAGATFMSCKWLTLLRYCGPAAAVSRNPAIAYLFGWPGMDAQRFLSRRAAKPAPGEWRLAIAKIAFGGLLLWRIARLALPLHPLLAGWIAMTGLIFLLHFGLFHLLSLAWRKAGFDARPLMNAPILASSVGDFWSRRWNMAFRDAAYRLIFRPLKDSLGSVGAALAVFVASGLVHDLVISWPAGAGFGLPTLYFVIQGSGFLLERRFPVLRRSWQGRCLAIAVVVVPLPLLFHAPFVNAVLLPMLADCGAV